MIAFIGVLCVVALGGAALLFYGRTPPVEDKEDQFWIVSVTRKPKTRTVPKGAYYTSSVREAVRAHPRAHFTADSLMKMVRPAGALDEVGHDRVMDMLGYLCRRGEISRIAYGKYRNKPKAQTKTNIKILEDGWGGGVRGIAPPMTQCVETKCRTKY